MIAALLASAVASADSVPNKARSLAERGRIAHDARDYAGAIAAFTEAYALAPAPGLLFNLAQAYRLRGNCDDAALMYRRFLATNPPDDARLLAESHLSTVERCLASRVVVTDPRLVALAVPKSLPRSMGSLTIGQRTQGEHVGPRDAPKKSSTHWRTAQAAGVGVLIGGGAALVLAGYYGLEAREASNDVERRYAAGEKWRTLAARDAEGDRAASIAKVSLGVGTAAALAGAAVLVIDHRMHKQKSLHVEPVSGGARVNVRWRF